MANPFEVESGDYFVLRNDEGQSSLWPGFAEVPKGWRVVAGPDTRQACLASIEQTP
ncbi:MbtH family protein [Amycolatopsis sp. WAC 01376]|uniref:MbtH family protein n=1 Tax=unclassified Amycolatopsis TaxID=2618356 RepID=UPI000F76C33C|nr:MbtH family protein [Amycolatopsis sp. WAC 01376]RSM66020.1 MbtH family protein [Amycolatopsis sp. WAC 01376]